MNSNYDNVVNNLASVTELSPDTIKAALAEVEAKYGSDEVREGLEELAERIIPTGEGLTRRQARKVLVEEMNALSVAKNQSRLRTYRARLELFWQRKQEEHECQKLGISYDGIKHPYPREPVFIKGYTKKNLNLAVRKARYLGNYGELLAAAGF